jgi:hypothetical protein
MSSGALGLVGAAVTVGLYLVAIGAWEELGETFGGRSFVAIPSEAYGNAHAHYSIGTGATHLANFTILGSSARPPLRCSSRERRDVGSRGSESGSA